MEILHLMLPNTLVGHLSPPEDASAHRDGKLFALADGVTRDSARRLNWPHDRHELRFEGYPRPSCARTAADLFCERFLAAVRRGRDIAAGFRAANRAIRRLNARKIRRCDYLANDWCCCTAVGAFVRRGHLHWGVIGDCGLAVFSRSGKRKLATPNSVAAVEEHIFHGPSAKLWGRAAFRRFVRRTYRNKPGAFLDDDEVSFGVLTGEPAALQFLYQGRVRLAKGDLVILYSDGFAALLDRPDFFRRVYSRSLSEIEQALVPFSLQRARQDQSRNGRERTLLAFIHN